MVIRLSIITLWPCVNGQAGTQLKGSVRGWHHHCQVSLRKKQVRRQNVYMGTLKMSLAFTEQTLDTLLLSFLL